MPDFDMMIELAKLYDEQTEETLYSIADYTNAEKERLLKNQHFFAWIGVIAWIIFLTLQFLGLADEAITEEIASFAAGIAFAMSILTVIYSGRHISKIQKTQKRILKINH